mgnify:CR=1 FL=1|tara:strand:+ start:16797 stop:17546 length:750 start_codon:yes stop_codon:yes gene_type:complete
MSIIHIEEPELLRKFRLETPNATWKQLKANSDVNNALKVNAINKTGGLCIYCEHKLIAKTDYQIEHFYPKKGNDNSYFGDGIPNRAIEWQNLYPGCLGGTAQASHFSKNQDKDHRTGANKKNKGKLTCGQKKGEIEPDGVLIPPILLNNRKPIFSFNDADGSIFLNEKECVSQNISQELATTHIIRLNLDSERLKQVRLAFASSLRKQFHIALTNDPDNIAELIEDWLGLNEDARYKFSFISLIASKYN